MWCRDCNIEIKEKICPICGAHTVEDSPVKEHWCTRCNIKTNEEICPVCGDFTAEDKPMEVYWCNYCKIPIINEVNQADKGICPICESKTKYMSKDLRPVFPEERLLLEILSEKEPFEYMNCSVWAANNRYYVNGKSIVLSNELFQFADVDKIRVVMAEHRDENSYDSFNTYINRFVEANKNRLNYLIDEAGQFVRSKAVEFKRENLVISFSGGKDSTVTAEVVIRALSDSSLVHIFGDTTLEFPLTMEYAERYRQEHPYAIFQTARNYEQNFEEVCEDIGPPARMMRWCCSMFKTGPITRVINSLYGNEQILTFYGIRKAESVSRSKYNRFEDAAESVKIQQQAVASPIFFWRDIDIWLYLLSTKIDFNDAYRLGYDRVGCWCCPNNNQRAQFLARLYMPEKATKWRSFLIAFADKIGKPDPEVYVDEGWWKARQGGNGLKAANDVKIKFANCTAENHAKIYRLARPFDDELIGMLVPFGKLAPELGSKLLNETIVLDIRTSVPIISVQPFGQEDYEYAVKIRTMNVVEHDDLQRMIGYQIRKFNACRKCLKCESLCRSGAISIVGGSYYINPEKCVHCKMCVTAKYLEGGCMMDKYLRTK